MTHIGSLLLDAATLMVTGMAVVFLFLTLLVYLVQFMSRVIPARGTRGCCNAQEKSKSSTSH